LRRHGLDHQGVLMSIGRIRARAALVGLGVLASLALLAAPSWAAKGGNGGNAKLCGPGGYPGALLAQDGSAFKNAGKCTSYAAKGGQIAGVNAVPGPVIEGESIPFLLANYSGFGLKPGSSVFLGFSYQLEGTIGFSETVAGNGTFSLENVSVLCLDPELGHALLSALVIEGETAAGAAFIREFSTPPFC
jgi:hypothetical protein